MQAAPDPENSIVAGVGEHWFATMDRLGAVLDQQIPEHLLINPETARHARLVTRFSSLGSLFGAAYALFYLLIGHYWGTGIIVASTIGISFSPRLMRGRRGSIERAGNFFSAILTIGFLGLSLVEGGVHGHAIAWLVSVPLCALLLTGTRLAVQWAVISFLAAALIIAFDLAGIKLPVTYNERWNPVVSAAGYLGLIVFMFILGFIFENGRASSFAKMQQALGQLEKTNEQLIATNIEKNEFLGIAAHDLKNPLTAILTSGELLKLISENGRTSELAEMIIAASERMHKLVTNLLDVNAIEEGHFASNLVKCDLSDLVRQCVEYNLPGTVHKDIKIRIGIPDEIYVRADCVAASQVLDNLISNAVKYSPLNTTIHVHVMTEKNQALVLVRDEGPGISEEDQKKLFQKFSRLSAVPTGGESSTGLGLAIAKRLAEAMEGTVECHSSFGSGATFSFRLPIWPESVRAPVVSAPMVAQTGKVKISIDASRR